MKSDNVSRRLFLKQALAFSAVSAIPSYWIPGANAMPGVPRISANDKVRVAFIGIGNRGADISQRFSKTGLCEVVALCDVDMGAKHTQKIISLFPNVPRFQDFRKMFDQMADKIDAVTVCTPDHTHFPITIEAMAHGKHVYVEKPMARTFQEVELMMQAEKKFGVVTQMGNQGHSEANYFQFESWKEAGLIKDVTAITAHMNNPRRWHGWNPNIKHMPMGESIPETLDWDTWLGVCPHHEYNHDYHLGQWRCWYDFGMGTLGDWGAHLLDTAHEFLDLGLPNEINPIYLKDHNPFFYPMSSRILFKFPERGNMPAVDVTWHDGLDNIPTVPENYGSSDVDPNIPSVNGGKLQLVSLNPGKEIYTKTLTFKGGSHGSTLSVIPDKVASEMKPVLPEYEKNQSDHYTNFLLACQGKETTRSPFSVAGPLSQVFCLGVLAQRLNRKLVFDRNLKQISNDPVANKMLVGGMPRKGWEQYYTL